jgi:uncharacterized membrane protein YphA (DoxX/SURF4 family)
MSVDQNRTLTHLKNTFEVLHVVIPAGVMGILLITGLKPVPAAIMGLLICLHTYLFAEIPGRSTCSGQDLVHKTQPISELPQE